MVGEEVLKTILNFNWWMIFWGLMAIGIIVVVIMQIRKKMIFKYPVRIFKARENGEVKEVNGIGGYIGRKNSASFFRIQVGKMPWNKINLNTTPTPKYMDQDNRVYYKQIDLNTYIQMRRTFSGNTVNFEPVEQDVKYGAILDIQKIRTVLNTESKLKQLAPVIGMVLIFILAIVLYWLVLDTKCPNI
jgi:hypothetical protein